MLGSHYLRLGVAVLGVVVLPDERAQPAGAECAVQSAAAAAPRGAELVLADGGGMLSSRYGLSVVELPEPPSFDGRPPVRLRTVCPVEVRAIIVAEPRSESFVVLATGADSKIVRVGEGLRAAGSLVSVAAIESSAVVLRQDENLVRCQFKR